MNKTERNECEAKGFTILRSQFNQQHNCWKIARHTPKGGWEVYKNDCFDTAEAADDIINWYVRQWPDKYKKD